MTTDAPSRNKTKNRHLLHFSPLGSDDAKEIHRLQKALFPPALRESRQEIRQILKNTEKFLVCNLSFGLFDDTALVGYVFAYVESESVFYRRQEDVLYIKEIALAPDYQRNMTPMFNKFFLQWRAFTPGMPLEAHAQADSLATWRRLMRTMRYFGLELTTKTEESSAGRPAYELLRLDVAETTVNLRTQAMPLPAKRWHYRDDVTVSVISDPRQWLSLKVDWEKLLQATGDHNVFQSFEYLWEWWKYFGTWQSLRVIVIRQGESVIGVGPLMLEHFPIFGKTVRKLMFISAPMEMNRPKFLFGQNGATCFPALFAYLETHAGDWDVLDIDEQMHGEDLDAMRRHFKAAPCLVAESGTLCPYIDMDGDWGRFLSRRSRKMRSNIKRLRRKSAGLGQVNVRLVSHWPDLDQALDTHCEIEGESWKASKHLDLADDKSHYFFYRSLARVFGQDGKFELRFLECDGKALASTFGILHDNVFQSLKIAHRNDFDKLSPGTVLESFELEALFERGIDRYEFMGSFLANKLRWTSTVFETTNVHVYRRRPRLVLFYFIFFVFKRRVKAVLKKTGQFDHVDRFLGRFRKNPFPRY